MLSRLIFFIFSFGGRQNDKGDSKPLELEQEARAYSLHLSVKLWPDSHRGKKIK